MKHEDAVTIVGIISDVITSRRGASLFPNGKGADPSNLGAIWIDNIERLPDEETEIATRAAVALMNELTTQPTPRDFRDALGKLRTDKRMATPALPEPEFVRNLPKWVKGKVVALSRDDYRAWPEQKQGYDYLQLMNSEARNYIWSEQEPMPEEEQEKYKEIGATMTGADFEKFYQTVIARGSVRGIPS